MNKNKYLEITILFLNEWGLIIGIFSIGIWWVVLKPMGPTFNLVIGDLGDARFNNFILEHFFRWIKGFEADYWNPTIFYPYPYAIAFSDNLLGSAPIYALFRLIGFGIYDSFQGWFIVGFTLNYLAAAYVFKRFQLNPLAISFGAFFFAFGLPMLAQEGHAQLIYRFSIPLLFYAMIKFYQKPGLIKITEIAFWFTWQFYLGMYLGIFTIILLPVIIFIIPFTIQGISMKERGIFWFVKFRDAWMNSDLKERLLASGGLSIIILSLFLLLEPYYLVSSLFHASRSWEEVTNYLPTIKDYFLSDNSLIWHPITFMISQGQGLNEHQSFAGIAVTLLLLIGMVFWKKFLDNKLFTLFLFVFITLFALTISINGFTFAKYLFGLPGLNGVRVISRIPLVMMFPIAMIASIVLDTIISISSRFPQIRLIPYVLTLLLILESGFTITPTYSKTEAESRLADVQKQIPAKVPGSPILFIRDPQHDSWLFTSLDSMFVAQQLGWPLFGGYTGWMPPGFGSNDRCSQLPKRLLIIADELGLSKSKTKRWYEKIIDRVVPVGFTDCDPTWWVKMPVYEDLP